MTIPAKTSDGKCTYRYNLENAINTARIPVGIQSLCLKQNKVVTTVNELAVCPDGKENPPGAFINNSKAGF